LAGLPVAGLPVAGRVEAGRLKAGRVVVLVMIKKKKTWIGCKQIQG
jgi:translation elongation factor EF-Tu-like GTPase